MNNSRQEQLLHYIRENRKASMTELCAYFSISMSTLRRDLKKLQETGSVNKIYGGIEATQSRKLTPLSTRIDINHDGKLKIARNAALSIVDRDVIFMDSGSTVSRMAPFLSRLKALTVITNNMLVINKVIQFENIELITLSGTYNRNTFSFVGETVAELLKSYNISKAFMGTTGFSLNSGITHSTQLEAAVKRAAVNIAAKVYLLADHLKVDTFAPYTYCGYKDVDRLYTDQTLPKAFEDLFYSNGCEVCVSE